ncbi:MAG: YitT family protein [Firmicutes bacterium HGW-Firmicutes-15]|nr:MAG: YitT family protein [Firmicutes bacterium HGW-Firmicutes-15]
MNISEPMGRVASQLKKFKEKISYQDILGILMGSFILALSIEVILVPAHILTGGVTGIAIILKFLVGVDIWVWYIGLNIPIFIMGYKFISKRFALYSLIGMLALTLFLRITQNWHLDLGINNLLLSAILGGVLSGLGSGICLRSKGSSGGMDIIAVIISNFWGYNFGSIFFSINLIILGVFLFASNIELTLFSAISMYVSSKVVDNVQTGSNLSKTAMIVSEQCTDIAAEILHNLNRGCTYLAGRGAYTDKTRDIIMVTVARTQLPRLKEIVFQIDSQAFITINETIEVLGKGFKKSGPEF